MASNALEKTLRETAVRNPLLDVQGDEDLLREFRLGNQDALGVIFDRYHRLVFATALRILKDFGEAEDLMQSVFFEIVQKVEQFDPAKGSFVKWILMYAYHRSFDRKNYLTMRQFYCDCEEPGIARQEIWTTKVSLPAQEAKRLAREYLALLDSPQREVLELVFFQELSFKEIAELTKQTFGNVRNHYYRALKRLRAHSFSSAPASTRQAINSFGTVDHTNA